MYSSLEWAALNFPGPKTTVSIPAKLLSKAASVQPGK